MLRPRRSKAKHRRPSADAVESEGIGDFSDDWVEGDDGYKKPEPYKGKKEVKIGEPGTTITVGEAFSAVFPKKFFELVKEQTNLYASQSQRSEGRTGWKTMTMADVRRFLAMLFHMALVHKPSMRHYFSTNPVLDSSFTRILGLSRDRFFDMLKYVHLNNNALAKKKGDKEYDPLFKVRPLYDMLVENFQSLYVPSENLTVDEGIVPYRGPIRRTSRVDTAFV